MPDSLLIDLQTALMAIALTMPRVLVCLIILPGFGAGILRGMIRNAVAMAIALPAVLPTFLFLQKTSMDNVMVTMLGFKEAAIGLLFGVLLSIPMWVAQSIGSIFDIQRSPIQTSGAGTGGEQDASFIGILLMNALVVAMIQAGLFIALARILMESYGIWPAYSLMPPFETGHVEVLLQRVVEFFWHILVYGTPVLLPLLLIDFGVASIGVFSRSFPVSFVTSPIKSLAGLFILLVYWPTFSYYVMGDFARIMDILPTLLQAGPQP